MVPASICFLRISDDVIDESCIAPEPEDFMEDGQAVFEAMGDRRDDSVLETKLRCGEYPGFGLHQPSEYDVIDIGGVVFCCCGSG